MYKIHIYVIIYKACELHAQRKFIEIEIIVSRESRESREGCLAEGSQLSALLPTRYESVGCDDRRFIATKECCLQLAHPGWHIRAIAMYVSRDSRETMISISINFLCA